MPLRYASPAQDWLLSLRPLKSSGIATISSPSPTSQTSLDFGLRTALQKHMKHFRRNERNHKLGPPHGEQRSPSPDPRRSAEKLINEPIPEAVIKLVEFEEGDAVYGVELCTPPFGQNLLIAPDRSADSHRRLVGTGNA